MRPVQSQIIMRMSCHDFSFTLIFSSHSSFYTCCYCYYNVSVMVIDIGQCYMMLTSKQRYIARIFNHENLRPSDFLLLIVNETKKGKTMLFSFYIKAQVCFIIKAYTRTEKGEKQPNILIILSKKRREVREGGRHFVRNVNLNMI